MKTIKPIVLLLAVLCISVSNVYSQNWPMVGGCKERTSCAQNCSNFNLPLTKEVVSSSWADEMAYYEGVLYISYAGANNELHAIDAQTGNVLWTFVLQNSAGSVGVVPAVCDSVVLIGGQNAAGIYAICRVSGCPAWSKPIGAMYTRNPIIDDEKVYVVTDSLYCLDLYDGATIWSQTVYGQITPAVDENHVYVFGNGFLNAFDKNSGNIVWQTSASYYAFAGIAVDQYFVYTEKLTSVSAFDKTNGTPVWTYDLPSGELSGLNQGPLAISENIICLALWDNGQGNGQITAINRSDGAYLWHQEQGGEGTFTPLIANGMVFIVNWTEAKLYGFDLSAGNQVFSDDSESYENQPIIGDEAMYVISADIIRFNPTAVGMEQNHNLASEAVMASPNPCNSEISFIMDLDKSSMVGLGIYDLSGSTVYSENPAMHEAGPCRITCNTEKLVPGTYIYRILLNGKEFCGKFIRQ